MFKKVVDFCKKNWKIIAVILGVLLVSGILKRFIGRLQMLWSIRKTKSNPDAIDFDFMAMSVHTAMYSGLFNLGENEDAIIALVNTLPDMNSYLELCRRYALKYSKDLRTQIRENFNDEQYSKLNWR